MRDDRAPGPTFAIADLGWVDFETRGRLPISVGTDLYTRNAQAIMLAWAIGDGPMQVEAVSDLDRPLRWADMPKPLRAFVDRVLAGEAWLVAHNAGFDRAVWNNATDGFPELGPYDFIDTRVQAAASGLPAALNFAAAFAGGPKKDSAGRDLIKLFTLADSVATPQTHPAEWAAFRNYALGDIDAMRGLFRRTRQLPLAEWAEYWAAEMINDTGIGIDLAMVEAATAMAAHDRQHTSGELRVLTEDFVGTVNEVKNLVYWLAERLPADGRAILTERVEERDPATGEVVKPHKWSLTRDRIIRLLAWLDSLDPFPEALHAARRVLQIRLYGGSKTPAKFGRMLSANVDGILRGQYVFNGASQTGRFSARGIQVHNLARDPLPYEIDAIDALLAGIPHYAFSRLCDDAPVSRKLSLLIRPALVAQPGNAFVWADWANIEARLLPWLAKDPEADKRLEVFSAVDADPSLPDLYTRTAATLMGVPVGAVSKADRQRGKVTELALGFGGATGALLNMAAGYGMHLDEDEAKATVERWREANQWAKRFWGRHDDNGSYGLWGAVNRALETPGRACECGRVSYIFLKQYLGGSLLCRLPSGRFLTYRKARYEMVEEVDEDSGEVVDVRRELMFSRDMGRMKMWPGLMAENVVQAAAADLLRGTLARLAAPAFGWMPVRLHTHDEVLVECEEAFVNNAAGQLLREFERGFDWTEGLPIKAETTIGRWYSKAKESWGL